MQTIEATYRIVTPMFLGDARQQASTLRPPSFKGALRFWWRALEWDRVLLEQNEDVEEALRALHQREARLFGLAAGCSYPTKEGVGQSRALITIETSDVKSMSMGDVKSKQGLCYLLGQGLYDYKNGVTRQSLSGRFTVRIAFRRGTDPRDTRSVGEALLLLGLLGGMGSRARKGFGSLAIESLDGEAVRQVSLRPPTNVNEYVSVLRDLVGRPTGKEPPFSAFSDGTRIDVVTDGNDPLALLNQVGVQEQLYRSYGRQGKVGNQRAEQNFADDHDLVFRLRKDTTKHPRRVVFGLPHNYYFGGSRLKVDVNASGQGRARRASPLIIHTHQFPDNRAIVTLCLLQACFLPERDPICLSTRGCSAKVKASPDWSVVTEFMDRFQQRKAVFP